ncbi:uncharacterized protein [Palaemon carinicauda]|uniref:uncharacterized protein n=1 Tax=Palaemon carinicauda TaxID=392227 RepID=UPI0035B6976A
MKSKLGRPAEEHAPTSKQALSMNLPEWPPASESERERDKKETRPKKAAKMKSKLGSPAEEHAPTSKQALSMNMPEWPPASESERERERERDKKETRPKKAAKMKSKLGSPAEEHAPTSKQALSMNLAVGVASGE